MAKGNGLGANLYIGGYDVSNDVGQVDAAELTRTVLEATGIDKSAIERLPGLYSGRIAFSGFFNDEAGKSHVALKSLPTADQAAMLLLGTTLGEEAAALTGKQIGYGWTRGADGSLGIQTEVLGNGCLLDWGKMLTAGKRTDSAANNGTGVDFGSSSSFGMVGYLEAFEFTGTSALMEWQHSSDDGATDPYGTVSAGTTQATVTTAPAGFRVEHLTQSMDRWLRIKSSGTFSNLVFACHAKRYASANREAL
jgi:hypothetical protein